MDRSLEIVEAAWRHDHESLVRRLTAVTRDPDVAEDLAQEAFLRLVAEVRAGRVPNDAAAWLSRVGTNLAMSRGRHLRVVDRAAPALVRRDLEPGPETAAIDREVAVGLRSALATLAPDDRAAVVMAAHGYDGLEIAARIGRSHGATRTLLSRARARVRGRLVVLGLEPA